MVETRRLKKVVIFIQTIFKSMLNIFEFSHVKEIFISLYKKVFRNHSIMLLDRDNKTKLVPAFSSYFL